MFTNVSLKNFKCFSSEKQFTLKKINVFTGYNGRGKSTVMQAFLLLAQSLYDNKSIKDLLVNGMFCKLGLFEDLVCRGGSSKEIQFCFSTDGEKNKKVQLSYIESSDRKGALNKLTIDGQNFFEKTAQLGGTSRSTRPSLQSYPVEIHSLFENFCYVSADRLGPTPFEVKQDLFENNPVGNSGEFRLNVLAGRDELQKQMAEIISRIMDGGIMSVKGDSDEDKSSDVLKLFFSSLEDGQPVKAINSGFGYSYIVPIILAALNMRGGCLFIENPEAHLHPYAQSQLTKELVRLCSANRVQLFIETHSEHVINAIRLCSLLKDEYPNFTNEDLAIYFFDKDLSIKDLTLGPDGQISQWPLGFFDQAERDVARIIQLGFGYGS